MARCDGKPSAIRGCLPRATISNKPSSDVYGARWADGLYAMLASKPDVAMELMEVYGVDADTFDDEYAATTILCRKRLDQVLRRREKAEPMLLQAQRRWLPLRRW